MEHLGVTSRHTLTHHDLSRCLGALWFVCQPAFLVVYWSLVTISKRWTLTGLYLLKAPCKSWTGLLSFAMLNMKYSLLLLVIESLWHTIFTVTSHQCPHYFLHCTSPLYIKSYVQLWATPSLCVVAVSWDSVVTMCMSLISSTLTLTCRCRYCLQQWCIRDNFLSSCLYFGWCIKVGPEAPGVCKHTARRRKLGKQQWRRWWGHSFCFVPSAKVTNFDRWVV